jgi:hypothetical protein
MTELKSKEVPLLRIGLAVLGKNIPIDATYN